MEHQTVKAGDAPAPIPYKSVRDVLIVEDHPLMSEALSMTLQAAFRLNRVRCVATLGLAEATLRADGLPDAVLLDLHLPDVKGIEGVIRLKSQLGKRPLTMISAEVQQEMVTSVIAAGAAGYISKSLPRAEMIDACRRMWQGETVLPEGFSDEDEDDDLAALTHSFSTLTQQQMNILRLICQGRPNKIISYELSIAEATVKTHIAAIMSKVNARNRTQIALLANRARLFGR